MEETDERRVLDEASAKAEERQATITDDKDDETARVYGQIEDESLNGMTMYIEPSESQDTTKLKFKVKVLEYSSEHIHM